MKKKKLWISQMGGDNFGLYRVLFNEADCRPEDLCQVLPPTRNLYDAVMFCLGFRAEMFSHTQTMIPIDFNFQVGVESAFSTMGQKAAEAVALSGLLNEALDEAEARSAVTRLLGPEPR